MGRTPVYDGRVFFPLIPTLTWMSPFLTDLGLDLFGHGIDQLSRSPNVTPHKKGS